MKPQYPGTFDAGRPFDILGISDHEERAYRWLLHQAGASASQVSRALNLTPAKAQRLLDAIEGKGLTTRTPERPQRYIAVAPHIALNGLALRRKEELQQAERAIQELQIESAVHRHAEQDMVVELITNRDAGKLIYEQILRSAQQEIAVLVRPPVLYNLLSPTEEQKEQRAGQARGVRCRSINDAEFLSLPGALDRVRADISAGEEARAFPSLPFKMVLIDHRVALIPLNPDQSNSPSLLVRYSALLDALYTLFEILWERATPLSFTRNGALKPSNHGTRLSEGAADLAWLMAVGLNDKNVAHNLNISLRTLERRVAELMQSLDTRSRFQTGWAAALHLAGGAAERGLPTAGRYRAKSGAP